MKIKKITDCSFTGDLSNLPESLVKSDINSESGCTDIDFSEVNFSDESFRFQFLLSLAKSKL